MLHANQLLSAAQLPSRPQVLSLLTAPFDEAIARSNHLKFHMRTVFQAFLTEDAETTQAHHQHLTQMYLSAVDRALQQWVAPQHGTIPGETSLSEFADILSSVNITHALREIPSESAFSEKCFTPELSQQLQESLGRVLEQVVSLPLLPGEAAQLVQCWAGMSMYGDWTAEQNMVQRVHDLSSSLSLSLLGSTTTTTGHPKFVAKGTPPATPLSAVSWEHSTSKYFQALYYAGKPGYLHEHNA